MLSLHEPVAELPPVTSLVLSGIRIEFMPFASSLQVGTAERSILRYYCAWKR
jgi:hypothetical protein